MITSGMILEINDYGLEFDSFLGAIYLPWRTFLILGLLVVALRVRKVIKTRKAGK